MGLRPTQRDEDAVGRAWHSRQFFSASSTERLVPFPGDRSLTSKTRTTLTGVAALKALQTFDTPNRAATVRGCERNARKRARQTKPSAPPVQAWGLSWWRRRFCLVGRVV